jgi:hypothetical protein
MPFPSSRISTFELPSYFSADTLSYFIVFLNALGTQGAKCSMPEIFAERCSLPSTQVERCTSRLKRSLLEGFYSCVLLCCLLAVARMRDMH